MFRECLSNTTAHGVPHLVHDKNNAISKLIWTLILLASCSVFLYHSSSLIEKYVKHETAVSVKIDGTPFIIPDIYICNDNPFSRFMIDRHFENKDEKFMEMANSTQIYSEWYLDDIFKNRHILGYSKEFVLDLISNRRFEDIGLDTFTESTPLLDNYGIDTGSQLFDQVYNTYHSFCYKLKDFYKTAIFNYGYLQFEMYTDQFNSTEWPLDLRFANKSTDYSHSVYFVNPGDYPHRESRRVDIERGKKTSIQVTSDHYERMSTRKQPCEKKRRNVTYILDWYNVNSTKFSYKENAHDCSVEKYHERYLSICNCSYSIYPLSWKLRKNVRACWYHQMNLKLSYRTLFCLGPTYQSVEEFYPNCSHKNPCKMSEYFTQVIKDEMNFADAKNKQSFARISIHAPKRLSRVWREYEAYELKDLLSDIGGILGFYVGISVVTVLEIFGYLGRLISWRRENSHQPESIEL